MISKDIICAVKRDKFYKAIEEMNLNGFPPLMIFYSFIIFFRYRSFIKCTKNQEERDLAYVAFYKVKGTMWGGIIMGVFFILIMVSVITNLPKN